MQQTVDVDALTKDQIAVVAETILVSGLLSFFYAVAEMVSDAVAVVMTAAYGSSSSYSVVVDSVATEADVVAVATTDATKIIHPQKASVI